MSDALVPGSIAGRTGVLRQTYAYLVCGHDGRDVAGEQDIAAAPATRLLEFPTGRARRWRDSRPIEPGAA